jgi:hypothetical protein
MELDLVLHIVVDYTVLRIWIRSIRKFLGLSIPYLDLASDLSINKQTT